MIWWKYKKIESLISTYEMITNRERKVILLAIFSFLLLCVYLLAIEPLFNEYQSLVTEQSTSHKKIRQIEHQLEVALEGKLKDPNIQLQKDIIALENKNLKLDQEISELTKSLVAPKQMVLLLEGVLESDKKMKLISFINLPREDVDLSLNVSSKNSSGGDINVDLNTTESLIYKHSFEIEMESTYDSAVSYLKRIDKLPWKIFWQDLRYEIGLYPYGNLKVRIYTLSTSKEVLGV